MKTQLKKLIKPKEGDKSPKPKDANTLVFDNIKIINNECKYLSFNERDKLIALVKRNDPQLKGVLDMYKSAKLTRADLQQKLKNTLNAVSAVTSPSKGKLNGSAYLDYSSQKSTPKLNKSGMQSPPHGANKKSGPVAVPLVNFELGFNIDVPTKGKTQSQNTRPRSVEPKDVKSAQKLKTQASLVSPKKPLAQSTYMLRQNTTPLYQVDFSTPKEVTPTNVTSTKIDTEDDIANEFPAPSGEENPYRISLTDKIEEFLKSITTKKHDMFDSKMLSMDPLDEPMNSYNPRVSNKRDSVTLSKTPPLQLTPLSARRLAKAVEDVSPFSNRSYQKSLASPENNALFRSGENESNTPTIPIKKSDRYNYDDDEVITASISLMTTPQHQIESTDTPRLGPERGWDIAPPRCREDNIVTTELKRKVVTGPTSKSAVARGRKKVLPNNKNNNTNNNTNNLEKDSKDDRKVDEFSCSPKHTFGEYNFSAHPSTQFNFNFNVNNLSNGMREILGTLCDNKQQKNVVQFPTLNAYVRSHTPL
jgi:hypothetical protein